LGERAMPWVMSRERRLNDMGISSVSGVRAHGLYNRQGF
jgi:hypothetical protein